MIILTILIHITAIALVISLSHIGGRLIGNFIYRKAPPAEAQAPREIAAVTANIILLVILFLVYASTLMSNAPQ